MLGRRLAIVLALSCTQCSWCAAPKPSGLEDDDKDRDAAPHAPDGEPRCETRATLALPGPLMLGRVAVLGSAPDQAVAGARVLVGAQRGGRDGVLEVDGLTARFVETSAAVGDAPPPLPVASGKQILVVAYEGAGKKRHLVVRDVAAPAKAAFELPAEAPDDSLAYDAVARLDGSIAIAWDAPAPAATQRGSSVFATIVRAAAGGGAAQATVTRLSPDDVDADTPRLVSLGPTLLATWIAHRAIAKDPDAAAPRDQAIEGPGEDLDHAWIELLPFDETLHPSAPLRHLTPDSGRVTLFDALPRGGNVVDVVARDAIEPAPGQGGSALLVHLAGPDIPPPVVLATGVGRGLPFVTPHYVLYDDPNDAGRASSARGATDAGSPTVTPEPSLDGARPLASLGGGDLLVAPEGGAAGTTELRVVRCRP